MKITGVAVMAVMVGTSVLANAVPADERKVIVCMAHTDIRLEKRTKAVSSGIFAEIGVKIQWHDLSKCPTEESSSLSQTRRPPA